MNERIRELWDQAAKSAAAYPSGENTSWETQVNFLDKFAELIEKDTQARHFSAGYTAGQSDGTIQAVKQCLFLCDQVDLAGADDCIDNIKQHFGVEE